MGFVATNGGYSRLIILVNLGERVTRTPPLSTNKAAHSGFETQRRHHQKPDKKDSCPPKIFFKKINKKKQNNDIFKQRYVLF